MEHSHRQQHLALAPEGNIIHIKDAENKKKYYCPFCHKEMITKRGAIREWHFAHKKEACSYDNYLHSIAKILIMNWFNSSDKIVLFMNTQEKCSRFKDCTFYDDNNCCGTKEVAYNLKEYYIQCTQEHKYGGFVADLYCENRNNSNTPLFIEIKVTHECSQNKKDSGVRIIEIPIQSEEDILNITRTNHLSENRNVKLYNFKRKISLSEDYKLPFQKFILHPSTKSFVDKETYSCRNYNTYRKGIYEISMPYDDCIPTFLFHGGLSMIGKAMAYNEKFLEKDCLLCSWKAQDMSGMNFCKLYKKCGNPKYCKENDSTKCSMFRADLNEIRNAIDAFYNYLKQCKIDVWKIQRYQKK